MSSYFLTIQVERKANLLVITNTYSKGTSF